MNDEEVVEIEEKSMATTSIIFGGSFKWLQ